MISFLNIAIGPGSSLAVACLTFDLVWTFSSFVAKELLRFGLFFLTKINNLLGTEIQYLRNCEVSALGFLPLKAGQQHWWFHSSCIF